MSILYVRNVKSDERTVVPSDSLWHIDTDKKIRWMFKPTEIGAFDPREEFGIVKEDKIIFHHILLMAKDREDLREKLKSEKIRVVTRRSFFKPVEEPLSDYTVKEEKAIVQQKKVAGKKTTKNVVAEDKIMKVFRQKQGKGAASATVRANEKAGSDLQDAAEPNKASSTPYQILEELWGDGKSSTPKTGHRIKSVGVEFLQSELDSCTKIITDLRKDMNDLLEENKSLQIYLRTKEEQFEATLSTMTSLIKELPDLIVQKMVKLKIQAPQECLLTVDLQIEKEAEFAALPVADDEWYLGAGFTLKRSIVKGIQDENHARRYGRLTALFKSVYGQDAVRYSVTGESDAGDDRHYNTLIDKKIPPCHYESLAKIMTFLEPPDVQGVIKPVTPKEVKCLLYKIPTDIRRRAGRESETEEQKKMRMRIEREARIFKKKDKERQSKKRCAPPASTPNKVQKLGVVEMQVNKDEVDLPTPLHEANINDSLLNIVPNEEHV